MRGVFLHPRMRREFFRRMVHEMGGQDRSRHDHNSWHNDCWDRPSPERRIEFLERLQRDLEQQVADVATKIKRLRDEMASPDSGGGDED